VPAFRAGTIVAVVTAFMIGGLLVAVAGQVLPAA
jgi:hypothetical protein